MATDHSAKNDRTLADLENAVLDAIQSDFPLSAEPYSELALRLGSSENEIYQIVNELRNRKIIRRIGGSFVAKKMGYVSVLVAAKVAPDLLESVAETINAFSEVTHNYQRGSAYNLWFTVIAENDSRLNNILDIVRGCAGVSVLHALPALRTFKIRVNFKFTEDKAHA